MLRPTCRSSKARSWRRSLAAVGMIATVTSGWDGAGAASIAAPRFTLSSNHAAVGVPFTVDGSGWGAGENEGAGGGCSGGDAFFYRSVDITVSLKRSDAPAVSLLTFRLDKSENGFFTRTVTVPTNFTAGPAAVRVSSSAADRVPAYTTDVAFIVD